jgi:hypothetical protein
LFFGEFEIHRQAPFKGLKLASWFCPYCAVPA